MEAKDTIINNEQIKLLYAQMSLTNQAATLALYSIPHGAVSDWSYFVARAQSEISFEAGKKEGIKEVVDIVSKRYGLLRFLDDVKFWQAKLQSWGINERNNL